MSETLNFTHPAVILGRLTEKLYRVEEYAQWKADENLIDHARYMLDLALELQASILFHDQLRQRLQLEKQLVDSVKQERDARQFKRISENVK